MAEQIVMRLERGGCALCDAPTQPDGAGIIKGSVGRGGRNNPDDVKAIQAALNAQDVADGGPSPKLAVDGIAGPLTTAVSCSQFSHEPDLRRMFRPRPDSPFTNLLSSCGISGEAKISIMRREASADTSRSCSNSK